MKEMSVAWKDIVLRTAVPRLEGILNRKDLGEGTARLRAKTLQYKFDCVGNSSFTTLRSKTPLRTSAAHVGRLDLVALLRPENMG